MLKVKKWRYYCEYCKKAGGHPFHMANHEKHCTMNPARHCRVCDSNSPNEDLINFVSNLPIDEWKTVTFYDGSEIKKTLRELIDKADGCPACVLSTLRLSGKFFHEFNYTEEMKRHWQDVNDERKAMTAIY